MATSKLPDFTSLGALPAANSGRPLATIDEGPRMRAASALAAGYQNLGRGIAQFGNAIASAQEKEKNATSELEAMQAKSRWAVLNIEQQDAIGRDTGYQDISQRTDESLTSKGMEILNGVSDPVMRQKLAYQFADDKARTIHAANTRAYDLNRSAQLGFLEQQGDLAVSKGAALDDEGERIKLIDLHRGLIDRYTQNGYLTPLQAEKQRQDFANKFATTYADVQASKGNIGAVISELERARLNAASAPPAQQPPAAKIPGPQSSLGSYTPEQMASIRGNANAAKPGPQWGDPRSADFQNNHLETITLDSGKKVTVNKIAAPAFQGFLNELEATGYKIDDIGGYNYRNIRGSGRISQHAFGNAIDINPDRNPDQRVLKTDLPPNVGEIAAKYGISWGGEWNSKKDAMHFEFSGIQPEGKTAVASSEQPGQPVKVASTDAGFTPGGDTAQQPAPEGTQVAQADIRRTPFDAMDPVVREKLLERMRGLQVKESAATAEKYERRIIDAAAGQGDLPDRKEIESAAIDDSHKNVLLRQWATAAGDVLSYKSAFDRFSKGERFNPYEKEDKENADKIFGALGADDKALTAVAGRTGILPASAAVQMRGDLISNDPKRVAASMTRASNLLAGNANIMANVPGGDDLEKQAIKFRTYVDTYGMSAEEAAARMIRDQSPEYKSSVNAKIKAEDVDEKIKKNLSINDLADAFDASVMNPLITNPAVGTSVRERDAMFDQYAELVKNNYLDTAAGDWGLAKKLAGEQLKKTWGVSTVNGKSTLMQYPPEQAPVYRQLIDRSNPSFDTVAGMINKQAVTAIKDETGQEVDPKSVRIAPIPGVTGTAYKSGQAPPYAVTWTDKNGVLQRLQPGRVFIADPNAMRAEQQAERQSGMDAALAEKKASEERMKEEPARKYIGKPIQQFLERSINPQNRDVRPLDKLPVGKTLGDIQDERNQVNKLPE